MPGQNGAVSGVEVQTALARILLDRIRRDQYPSVTQMGMLEETLPPPLLREYVNVLLEKVVADAHPSISMLRRIQRIGRQL
jgi:hypothetical protein